MMVLRLLALSLLLAIPFSANTSIVDVPQELYSEYRCMKLAMHYEARGEGSSGMIAVANVILNRVKSKQFPDSVCGVVNQRYKNTCQFSWRCDAQLLKKEPAFSAKTQLLAFEAVVNRTLKDVTGGAMWFHSTAIEPYWAASMRKTRQIGNHIFYRK